MQIDCKKRKGTVKIIVIINTVLISECCHSYCGKYILAHFGKNRNKNHKMRKFRNIKSYEKIKIILEVT